MENNGDTEPKHRNLCKGCLADVTETMFCECGEFALNSESAHIMPVNEKNDNNVNEEE